MTRHVHSQYRCNAMCSSLCYVICLFPWHKTRHSLDWDFSAFSNIDYTFPEGTSCSQLCDILLGSIFQLLTARLTAPGSALCSSTFLLLCLLSSRRCRRWAIPLSRQTCSYSCSLGVCKDTKKPDSNSSQLQPITEQSGTDLPLGNLGISIRYFLVLLAS